MAKKKKTAPDKLQIWIDARKKYRLSHAQVQMARELGLNPRNFGGIANYKQEPWKEPLPQFIERLYFKRFGKTAPDRVISIEEHLAGDQKKKQEKRARKQAEASTASVQPSGEQISDAGD
jgi:hypothetical protein